MVFFFNFSNNTYSQVNEFLKLKPSNAKVTPVLKRKEPAVKIIEAPQNKKPKINLVLASSPVQQQQQKVQANTGSLRILSFFFVCEKYETNFERNWFLFSSYKYNITKYNHSGKYSKQNSSVHIARPEILIIGQQMLFTNHSERWKQQ